MSPIFRFYNHGNNDEIKVDLRRIVMIVRASESDSSTIHMDPAEHNLCLHDRVADKVDEAWIAYHSTHTPAEPVGAPQLPEGWVISTADHCTTARQDRIGVYCEAIGSERTVISTVGYIPSEVVIAVIAAHRARGVR